MFVVFRYLTVVTGVFIFSLLVSMPVQAKNKVEIVSVHSSPRYYDAPCPARFRLVARIRAKRATVVKYRFVSRSRSDRPYRTLRLQRGETKNIMTSWRVVSSNATFRERVRLEIQTHRKTLTRRILLRGRCTNITSADAVGLRCPTDVIHVRRDAIGRIADPWTNARPRTKVLRLSRLMIRGKILYCKYGRGNYTHVLKRPIPEGLTRCTVIDNRYFRCE